MKENKIFNELSSLCQSKGYAHVVAYFCFRDNTIQYSEELKGEDLLHQFSHERLLRIEISALIGAMVKGNIDFSLPTQEEMQKLIDRTESLLHELHLAIVRPYQEEFRKSSETGKKENPFKQGAVMREPILYSGESAFNFQYRDLALSKYINDDEWFKKHVGYSVSEAHQIISAIFNIQNRKITMGLNQISKSTPELWTYLPIYTFTLDEVIKKSGCHTDIVKSVIHAFVLPENSKNENFKSISDFNEISAKPILKINKSEYLLFQPYSLFEAFYESPFFWMLDDSNYKDISLKNRGDFTEEFSRECLSRVFGKNRVFKSVEITDGNRNKVGEIDVLAIFGDRVIVVQAKSKKLTIEARKGNEAKLNSDFQKAIQESYEQGYSCSDFLQRDDYSLKLNNKILNINRDFKEIHIFCVVADHFPALTTLAFHKLKYKKSKNILPPFVMDVFHLDVMTEILSSPLQFLSYIKRRVRYAERLLATNEGVIIGYHLKMNLWLEDRTNYLYITDDFSGDIEVAMLARRESLPGRKVPEGIMTKYKNTPFDNILNQILNSPNPAAIELGLFLLQLGEDTIKKMNEWLEMIKNRCLDDGMNHDFSIGADDSGISVHCNEEEPDKFGPKLNVHSLGRKYLTKSDQWFGVCIEPDDYKLKCIMHFDEPWRESKEMDQLVSSLPFKDSEGIKI
ncbi:MAG: NERD domain-containing protein [Candidatus Paceibacterota bacterium]